MARQTTRQAEQRREERKRLRVNQRLHDRVLTPGLHLRYQRAATRVLRFWQESGSFPHDWDNFDVATGQWLEHIFAEGYPKGYASDGLAALQHFLPEIAGKLRHSWRLLKSWQKMEPPVRVLPISPLMVVAISGACVKLNLISAAAAFLLCFDTFLRPGELYNLRAKDVTWAGGLAVLSLEKTKTGQRKNAAEMVVCHSCIANFWLEQALADKAPDDFLLDCSPAHLRHVFFTILDHLQVPGYFSLSVEEGPPGIFCLSKTSSKPCYAVDGPLLRQHAYICKMPQPL